MKKYKLSLEFDIPEGSYLVNQGHDIELFLSETCFNLSECEKYYLYLIQICHKYSENNEYTKYLDVTEHFFKNAKIEQIG